MECRVGMITVLYFTVLENALFRFPNFSFSLSHKLTERFSLGILLLEFPPHPRAQFSIALTGLKLELSKEGRPAASPDLPWCLQPPRAGRVA